MLGMTLKNIRADALMNINGIGYFCYPIVDYWVQINQNNLCFSSSKIRFDFICLLMESSWIK
jgi:hypothetical protein